MPSPIVGHKLGIDAISAPDPALVKGTRVVGISGSSRQEPGMSKSERLLLSALDRCREFGCETTFIRLKDLKIYECEGNYSENPDYCTYPCQDTMKYEDDQMEIVYNAILDCDVLFLATPIRWNNHSALVQKFVERMNCIENQFSWFGKRLIVNKVVGLIIIGHVDGMQHVAGNLLNFFAWLGFHSPQASITSWVGEYDEDTTKDWGQIQKNPYTQQDLTDMVNSSLCLACSLKNQPRPNRSQ